MVQGQGVFAGQSRGSAGSPRARSGSAHAAGAILAPDPAPVEASFREVTANGTRRGRWQPPMDANESCMPKAPTRAGQSRIPNGEAARPRGQDGYRPRLIILPIIWRFAFQGNLVL